MTVQDRATEDLPPEPADEPTGPSVAGLDTGILLLLLMLIVFAAQLAWVVTNRSQDLPAETVPPPVAETEAADSS
ncbi:MAG: hypothetical protein KY462_08740 [Actinobacteria bacterium]|nr:hypothetical protein [Actinomycetota bacterium]